MGEFNTQQIMTEIKNKISIGRPGLSELHYTTFYYRKLIMMLKERTKLVLFGAGIYGEKVLAALLQEGIETVQCFCDNSDKTWGKVIDGLQVCSPQEAVKRYPGACFVITPKDYENEILRQLFHLGIDIENILIFNIKNTGIVEER